MNMLYVIYVYMFGITPKGLKLIFPIYGVPPSVRPKLKTLQKETSFQSPTNCL